MTASVISTKNCSKFGVLGVNDWHDTGSCRLNFTKWSIEMEDIIDIQINCISDSADSLQLLIQTAHDSIDYTTLLVFFLCFSWCKLQVCPSIFVSLIVWALPASGVFNSSRQEGMLGHWELDTVSMRNVRSQHSFNLVKTILSLERISIAFRSLYFVPPLSIYNDQNQLCRALPLSHRFPFWHCLDWQWWVELGCVDGRRWTCCDQTLGSFISMASETAAAALDVVRMWKCMRLCGVPWQGPAWCWSWALQEGLATGSRIERTNK